MSAVGDGAISEAMKGDCARITGGYTSLDEWEVELKDENMIKEEAELRERITRALSFARDVASEGTAAPEVIELARAYIDVGNLIAGQDRDDLDLLYDVFEAAI